MTSGEEPVSRTFTRTLTLRYGDSVARPPGRPDPQRHGEVIGFRDDDEKPVLVNWGAGRYDWEDWEDLVLDEKE